MIPLNRDELNPEDAAWLRAFEEAYPPHEPPRPLDPETWRERFDNRYLGDRLDHAVATTTNEKGGFAWRMSWLVFGLHRLFTLTGDARYLRASLRCARRTLAQRDDRIGAELWTGRRVTAWSSAGYADRGRALFAVHTGLITHYLLEFARLSEQHDRIREEAGGDWAAVRDGALEALAEHDEQWRDGPEDEAGHYIGKDQEEVCEGKPLPGNRLAAMGLAHWSAALLTGEPAHRHRAIAIARYIRNRMAPTPDDCLYWAYWLPEQPVDGNVERAEIKGEDLSHAGLTLYLPLTLCEAGEGISEDDMRRIARGFVRGAARLGGGVMTSNMTGATHAPVSHVGSPAHFWLRLTRWEPLVGELVAACHTRYGVRTGPLAQANLVAYAEGAWSG